MAWSTRQIAELAGTSLRTVRHYHDVGLLPEPERASNGYKRYAVAHLVRLLRIKRLTDLGFSLTQIAELGDADEHPAEELRALDVEIGAKIEQLQRVREELGIILNNSAPTDLPPELARATADTDLSDADRAFTVVMSRVLSPSAITAYKTMLEEQRTLPEFAEFDDLPAEADEQTRVDLAQRIAPQIRDMHAAYPGMQELKGDTPAAVRRAAVSVNTALLELYNPAQLDVLRRATQQN